MSYWVVFGVGACAGVLVAAPVAYILGLLTVIHEHNERRLYPNEIRPGG